MKITVKSLLLEALTFSTFETPISYFDLMCMLYDYGYKGPQYAMKTRGQGSMTYDKALKDLLQEGIIAKTVRGFYYLTECGRYYIFTSQCLAEAKTEAKLMYRLRQLERIEAKTKAEAATIAKQLVEIKLNQICNH